MSDDPKEIITVSMTREDWEDILMWHSDGVAERAVGEEANEPRKRVKPIELALYGPEPEEGL